MRDALAVEAMVMDGESPVHASVALKRIRAARPAPAAPAAPDDAGEPPPPATEPGGPVAPPAAPGLPPPPVAATLAPPNKVGLALSGGGIRSATFGLGVLQAFAAGLKLDCFDYLSTVSGGGYIGSWLSAWIHREGLGTVQNELGKFGSVDSKGSPAAAEPGEVAWLRRYSNYLAPRAGLLSFDTLTLFTTWTRNVVLNAVVILGFLCAVLMLPFLLLQPVRFANSEWVAFGFAAAWWGIVFLSMVGYNLWQQSMQTKRKRNWVISTPGVVSTVVAPAVLACAFAAIWLVGPAKDPDVLGYACKYVGILLTCMLAAWGVAEWLLKPKDVRLAPGEFFVMSFAGAVAFVAGIGVLVALHAGWHALLPETSSTSAPQRTIMLMLLGPPALVFAFGVATTVFTGMVGRAYFERSREWWSRLNAWLLSFGAVWVIWIALAFFSLPLLVWLEAQIGGWISLLGTGWIGSLLTAVLFKKPEGKPKQFAMKVDSALNIAAGVFVAGLLVVLAASMAHALLRLSNVPVDLSKAPVATAKPTYEVKDARDQVAYTVAPPKQASPSLPTTAGAYIDALQKIDDAEKLGGVVTVPVAMFLGLFGLVVLFSARVDVNKFSLHNMYKNRLVRCYLGASNQAARNEQPFTGLDDGDDFPLAALGGAVEQNKQTGEMKTTPAQRPVQIINTTLNITQGSNLAWQERKAASFIFTPILCGYSLERTQGDSTSIDTRTDGEVPGYRLTMDYGARDYEEKGFTLGMALATSGAAVSPNMGHASRPVRAFVLTLFNVRLGRWSANPAADTAWRLPSPRFGLVPLLQELFGYSNERRNFVYLSDGGHFENLGIYELVRRRCKLIVAVDAGADPQRKMGDFAEAVRKCRVDLGVEIELPELALLDANDKGRSAQGHALGVIRYDISDPAMNGTLILIKPSLTLTRDEPADVLNYAQLNPPFPQQTTADQFFDESQFESYRRLGLCIGEACLRQHGALLTRHDTGLIPDPPPLRREPDARSTIFIGWVLRKAGKRVAKSGSSPPPLPPRDGSLVDMHLGLLLLTIIAMGLLKLVDSYLVHTSEGACFSIEACEASLRILYQAHTADRSFLFRALLDNVFVLLYSGALVTGFMVGGRRLAYARFQLPAMMLLVLCLAGLDLTENIYEMSWTQLDPGLEGALRIAPVTAGKFVLTTVAVGILLLLELGHIRRVFLGRWGL
jgi:Patatin-like phospholipase